MENYGKSRRRSKRNSLSNPARATSLDADSTAQNKRKSLNDDETVDKPGLDGKDSLFGTQGVSLSSSNSDIDAAGKNRTGSKPEARVFKRQQSVDSTIEPGDEGSPVAKPSRKNSQNASVDRRGSSQTSKLSKEPSGDSPGSKDRKHPISQQSTVADVHNEDIADPSAKAPIGRRSSSTESPKLPKGVKVIGRNIPRNTHQLQENDKDLKLNVRASNKDDVPKTSTPSGSQTSNADELAEDDVFILEAPPTDIVLATDSDEGQDAVSKDLTDAYTLEELDVMGLDKLPATPNVQSKPKPSYLFHDPEMAERLQNHRKVKKVKGYEKPEDGFFSSSKTAMKKFFGRKKPSQFAQATPWLVNEKTAPKEDALAKYKFFRSARLRHKARNMIGATGSRHINQRRRASLASGTALPLSLVPNLEQVSEEESRMASVPRRRVVDTSDLRTCAILQSRLKELKTYPE